MNNFSPKNIKKIIHAINVELEEIDYKINQSSNSAHVFIDEDGDVEVFIRSGFALNADLCVNLEYGPDHLRECLDAMIESALFEKRNAA